MGYGELETKVESIERLKIGVVNGAMRNSFGPARFEAKKTCEHLRSSVNGYLSLLSTAASHASCCANAINSVDSAFMRNDQWSSS